MKLFTMHKVLIGTAIFGGIAFCGWSVFSWTQSQDAGSLAMATGSAAATVGMSFYLRNFMRKTRVENTN